MMGVSVFSLLVGIIGVIGDSRELEIIGVMDVPSADSVVGMGGDRCSCRDMRVVMIEHVD